MFEALKNFFFERDVNGNYWYSTQNSNQFTENETDTLQLAQNHPILTPGILFISNLFAQGKFILTKENGEEVKDHWLLKLFKNPNYYQTQVDLLESTEFMKIARGYCVIYGRKGKGAEKPDGLYVLDPELIVYPENFISPFGFRRSDEKVLSQKVRYNPQGENLEIEVRDLIYLFDLPSGFSKLKMVKSKSGNKIYNKFVSHSRVDSLKQTLWNTQDSLIAKNIILKTNGKEMISGKNGGFPLAGDEQKDAEGFINQGYGLSWTRKRTLLVKANLEWKSMHIALRDLGLDESIKIDGNIIYTALMIPKDIMSLEAKKTTYNNFKESMTSFIQNEMQTMMNDFCMTFEKFLLEGENLTLVGSYDHLPVMGFIEKEKYEAVKMRGEALNTLRSAGMPDEVCLEMLGLDTSMKLEEYLKFQPTAGGGEPTADEKEKAYLERLGIYDRDDE